ncbi:MAG: DNA recombination protein RmuC [Alphaproteobacteria bacterium]|nr:DNA recombination protein RmuC [Alphaproteobacteria bacterium]
MSAWLVVIVGASVAASLWFFARYVQLKERTSALSRIYEQTVAEKSQLTELLAIAQKEIGALAAHKESFGNTHETMKVEFRNTANALFEEVSQKFTVQSEKKIGDILLPLSQRIGEFQKNVDEKFGAQGKEQHTLKAEISRIVLQTEGLTKALRGDVKAQGNWGEVMLERILDDSGLVKGSDYILQASEMGLKAADGSHQKPDVIVNLPDGKHIIIDSKVSLSAYERYCNSEDAAEKKLQQGEFIRSIKNHITGLEGKRYQHNDKLESPDFVFMFLPVEGAYIQAVQQDAELHNFAWSKKIVLVCPSTLFASLITIASLWRIEKQSRHAQDIANEASGLYDKFVGFIDDMKDIGDKLGKTHKAYEGAMNKLSTGRGNVIGRIENLKTLGIKAAKSLPKELITTDETEEA